MAAENQKLQVANDVAALRSSFNDGKSRPFPARRASLEALGRLMNESKDLICQALYEDLHKSATEAIASEILSIQNEIQEQLDFFEDWASPQSVPHDPLNFPGSSEILSDPLGVCCIIGTWNYPFSLLLRPLAGCLAAGNTCLVRPPSNDTCVKSASLIAELLRKYMDDSIVRVVEGDVEATKAVLLQKFDKIFFTGGTGGGKFVARAAAETFTPVVLEMGGKSPTIVDSSVNMQVASKRVAWAAFLNAGQTCIRPDYVLVDASIGDQFIQGVKENVDHMWGKGLDEILKSPDYGRLVSARQYERVMGLVESDKKYIVQGGNGDEGQRCIEPTVMDFGTDTEAFASSKVMQDEIFGPIMPVLRYESLDQAIEFIRERPKPLTLYCFTTKKSVYQRVFRETSSGGGVVNDCLVQMSNSALCFGGVGDSGMGNYFGKFSFDTFSHKKSIMHKTFYMDFPQRYPPYTPFAKKMLESLLTPRPRKQTQMMKLGFLSVVLAIALKKFEYW